MRKMTVVERGAGRREGFVSLMANQGTDLKERTANLIRDLEAQLRSNGMSKADVFKQVVFLNDITDDERASLLGLD